MEKINIQGEIKLQEELDIALLLLITVERMFVSRKVYEAMHDGISTSFSDDPFVLIKLQEYLSDPKIKARLYELLKKTN